MISRSDRMRHKAILRAALACYAVPSVYGGRISLIHTGHDGQEWRCRQCGDVIRTEIDPEIPFFRWAEIVTEAHENSCCKTIDIPITGGIIRLRADS